jgi:hypothetical protein
MKSQAKERPMCERLGGIVKAPATSTTSAVKKKLQVAPKTIYIGTKQTQSGKMKGALSCLFSPSILTLMLAVSAASRLGPERSEVSSTTKGFQKTAATKQTVFSRLGSQL